MKILLRKYIQKESTSGIILLFVTILALVLRNSIFSEFYTTFLHTPIELNIGTLLNIKKPLILWINDGLMVVFFFLLVWR